MSTKIQPLCGREQFLGEFKLFVQEVVDAIHLSRLTIELMGQPVTWIPTTQRAVLPGFRVGKKVLSILGASAAHAGNSRYEDAMSAIEAARNQFRGAQEYYIRNASTVLQPEMRIAMDLCGEQDADLYQMMVKEFEELCRCPNAPTGTINIAVKGEVYWKLQGMLDTLPQVLEQRQQKRVEAAEKAIEEKRRQEQELNQSVYRGVTALIEELMPVSV